MKRSVLFLCVLASVVGDATAQVDLIRTVAMSGEQAPGLGSGVLFAGFETVQVNAAGHAAFIATLEGSGVGFQNDDAVYSESPSASLAPVIRSGVPLPGASDGTILAHLPPQQLQFSDTGQTAFRGRLSGPNTGADRNDAILRESAGGIVATEAREGNSVAGLGPNVLYGDLSNGPGFRLNNAGKMIFIAPFVGSGVNSSNDSAIIGDVGGDMSVIVREGEPAANITPGVMYSGFGSELAFNDNGHLLFGAGVVGSGTNNSNSSALFLHIPGEGTILVARKGDHIPGYSTGTEFGSPTSVQLSNSGHIAFQTRLGGFGNQAILRSSDANSFEMIALEDNPVPGLADGIFYGRLQNPVLNDSGHIAFVSSLAGAGVDALNNGAIMSDAYGPGPSVVVRLGDQAPGLAPGVNFLSFDAETLRLNGSGQIAVYATLLDGSSAFNGIFATDALGEVLIVAAEGQLFDVDSDPSNEVFRTISDISQFFDFNDSGHLGFTASFTDGSSGVFLVTVPTPSGITALGFYGVFACRRSKR